MNHIAWVEDSSVGRMLTEVVDAAPCEDWEGLPDWKLSLMERYNLSLHSCGKAGKGQAVTVMRGELLGIRSAKIEYQIGDGKEESR